MVGQFVLLLVAYIFARFHIGLSFNSVHRLIHLSTPAYAFFTYLTIALGMMRWSECGSVWACID